MAARKVILVVSFGTSFPDTLAKTIDVVERDMAGRFPEWEVRRAFTSRMIIGKLARDGVAVDHLIDALERLIRDGVRVVVLQPTHVMNGLETDEMNRIARVYASSFDTLSVGTPLMTSPEDHEETIRAVESAVLRNLPETGGRTAVVLMGHGSEHYANSTYSELQLRLTTSGFGDVYVTTVDGFPSFESTAELMRGKGYTDVVLHPFMLVAGDHAVNDMAGDGEGSLRRFMESQGYRVHVVVRGLGEYPEFQDMFARHAEAAMGRIL